MTKHHRFPPKVRQRAVHMVLQNQNTYNSQSAAVCYIAPKIGCTPETLRIWIRQQTPVDDAKITLTASERQRLKELERENRELRRSNDDSTSGFSVFCPSGARAPLEKVMPLLENLSGEYEVVPVCHEPDIAPSTYYWHQQRQKHPERRSCRDKNDARLLPEIQRVYEENYTITVAKGLAAAQTGRRHSCPKYY